MRKKPSQTSKKPALPSVKPKKDEVPVPAIDGVQEGNTAPVEDENRAKPNTETAVEVVVPTKDTENTEQERTRIKKKLFFEALRRAMGEIKAACELADIGRTQFYQWRLDDPDFRKELEQVEVELLDDVEGVELKLVRMGDGPSVRHWLDRRHPKYKPTLKTEIVTGTKTFEDLLYDVALKRKAIAEGKDPNTYLAETTEANEQSDG